MNTPNDKPPSGLDGAWYPADFLACYEPLECLSKKPESETLYVRERETGAFAVAKCYTDKTLLSRDNEGSILRALHHDGLPRFLGEYESDTMLCVVREYVSGTPLSELLEVGPLTQAEALPVLLQLCDILTYLHGQSPPVIHRDIKPQNVMLTESGKIKLIDFGVSRVYDEDAKKDTVFFGTQDFAPPEQYGYAQTDCRADLFSLGVMMGYLLTGQTELDAAASAITNKRLRRIYKKCTAFAPKERYESAQKLKVALLHSDGKRQRRALRLCAAAVFCVLFLGVGFNLGRYTDFLALPDSSIAFQEPMIEQAVRLQLGKAENESITQEELLSVTQLYLFGEVVAKTEQEMNDEAAALFEKNEMKAGSITSLADLSMLPNLQAVSVSMQRVSDLSPLSGLTQLTTLILKNNPIEDIAPLGTLTNLTRLSVFGASVEDFSPLSACRRLKDLDAGETLVRTPQAFAALSGLTNLNLYKLTLESLSGIEALSQLTYIELAGVADGNLSPLLSLPKLQTVLLDESLRSAAESIEQQAQFTIEYR